MPLEYRDVIVVGHETDLDRFLLVCRHQSQTAGNGPSLRFRQRTDRREHALHDGAVDAPQEIRLVLLAIEPAEQRAVLRDRVVSRRDRVTVERVSVIQKIPELRKRIAAYAGNRRAPTRVFADE